MGSDAWTELHGHQERPKAYVPPFLRDQGKKEKPKDYEQKEKERMDNLYSIEIDAGFQKNSNQKAGNQADPSDNRVTFLQDD